MLFSESTQAPVIFLAGQNARSATVRNLALPLARYEAVRVLPLFFDSALFSRSDVFDALWLLSESATLQIPTEPLLTHVSERLLRLPTTEFCQGTRFLLERQLPNGGWGGWEDGNAHDQIHAT